MTTQEIDALNDIGGGTEAASDFYIEPQTSLIERPLRTLKHGDIFAVLDSYGDIGVGCDGPEGVFLRDTRYLSGFDLKFEGERPLLLGSVVEDDNASLSANSSNPDIHRDGALSIPRDIIAMERTKLLFEAGCYERIGFFNYDHKPRTFRVSIRFAADFRDLFEVRGIRRGARGQRTSHIAATGRVELRYDGLDGIRRYTVMSFDPVPQRLETGLAEFDIVLEPRARCSIFVSAVCGEGQVPEPMHFLAAYRGARRDLAKLTRGIATVESSNVLFNEMACRSGLPPEKWSSLK